MDPALKLAPHQGAASVILQAISLENVDAGGCSGSDWSPGVPALLPFESQYFILDGLTFHRPQASRVSVYLNALLQKHAELRLWWGMLDPSLGGTYYGKNLFSALCL